MTMPAFTYRGTPRGLARNLRELGQVYEPGSASTANPVRSSSKPIDSYGISMPIRGGIDLVNDGTQGAYSVLKQIKRGISKIR